MKVTIEQVAALRTASRSYRLTPSDSKAREEMEIPAEEIVITWQKLDENPPTVTVTAATGPDGWHLPLPQRPDWLVNLIRSGAPEWWQS